MKTHSDPPHDLLQRKLELAIDEEIEKKAQVLKSDQETLQRLKDQDRELHARGIGTPKSEVESIDAQIDTVRHRIEEKERHLVAGEQLYSRTCSERLSVGRLLVGLTDAELENLDGLSQSYQAFAPHLAAGLDASTTDSGTCWTCSAACGGCTGCGQACSQLNACIGRHE